MTLLQQGQSLTDNLPVEIIGQILTFVKIDDSFFWNYGLVCKTFLKEVAKIMKNNNMIIELKGDKDFDTRLKMIFNDNDVSDTVARVGLDLSNNKLTCRGHYKQLFRRCKTIQNLNLSFCELEEEDLDELAKLSMLEKLNLSGSDRIYLGYFVKGMSMLSNLNLLMCENITDPGKLNLDLLNMAMLYKL